MDKEEKVEDITLPEEKNDVLNDTEQPPNFDETVQNLEIVENELHDNQNQIIINENNIANTEQPSRLIHASVTSQTPVLIQDEENQMEFQVAPSSLIE